MFAGIISVLHANLLHGHTHAVYLLLSTPEVSSSPDFWRELHDSPVVSPLLALHTAKRALTEQSKTELIAPALRYLDEVLPQSVPHTLRERLRLVVNSARNSTPIDHGSVQQLLSELTEVLTSSQASTSNVGALPPTFTPLEVRCYDTFDDIPMDEAFESFSKVPKHNQRTPPFTREEDNAIIEGVRNFSHRFQDIFLAFQGVWAEGRTTAHIISRWRNELQKRL